MDALAQQRIMYKADQAPYVKRCAAIQEACIAIMSEDLNMTLADCELILRDLGSPTYLVAWPDLFVPAPFACYDSIHKCMAPSCLWVCHDWDEREERMAAWNIGSAPENMRRLVKCGFKIHANLMPPPEPPARGARGP